FESRRGRRNDMDGGLGRGIEIKNMKINSKSAITRVIGNIPNRLALAGGWIDQPFISRHNPRPPGSMVVVSIQPDFPVLERAGLANGTRTVATKLWNG